MLGAHGVLRRGLRILVISPALPFPPSWGGGARVFHLLAHLAERHSVTLLSYARPDEDEAVRNLRNAGFDVHAVTRSPTSLVRRRLAQAAGSLSPRPFACREAQSAAMQTEIDRLIRNDRFDAVQIEFSSMQWVQIRSAARLIVDEHNLEHEVPERMRRVERSPLRGAHDRMEAFKWWGVERALWRRADGCMVTSAREAEVVQKAARHTPIAVVPNGVDSQYFAPTDAAPEPDTLVFIGLLTYRPNLDAITHFVRNVWPRILWLRPAAELTVVGHGRERDLDALRRRGVSVTGWVPDVRPYLRRAAVSIIPVRAGSGTRLKALESFSMAKAVVSTAIGCEGIDIRDREHLLVADEDDAFAGAVLEVLRDGRLARRLGAAARDLVEERYTWRRCVEPMDRLYGDVLSPNAGSEDGMSVAASVEA